MHTNSSMSFAPPCSRAFSALITLGLALPSGAASGATPTEQRIAGAPMPHKALAVSDVTAMVHFARLQGYLEGAPDNATRLAQMKTVASNCANTKRAAGQKANPPMVWPDHVTGMRTDTYAAANRAITYSRATSYAISPLDCSLMETETSQATLSSTRGVCRIDLFKKRAHGACSKTAHADAAPRVLARSDVPGARTGVKKSVLGLDCEEWRAPAIGPGTVCLSLGGAFRGAPVAHWFAHSGMSLEVSSESGVKLYALEAGLDTRVSSAVFAPYLQGGFTITNRGERE